MFPLTGLLALLFLSSGATIASDIRLIGVGERWAYLPGLSEPATNGVTRWYETGYSANWNSGPSGFSSFLAYRQATVLTDYGGQYRTVYFRKDFAIQDPSNIAELTLRIEYDDGFVAYLNGQEIARRGVAGVPGELVPVTADGIYHSTDNGELISFNAGIPTLRPGTNLLAIQLLGSGPFDAVMRFVPELVANVSRGPYVQNTTVDSTQIIWNTTGAATSTIQFGTNLASMIEMSVGNNSTQHVAAIGNLAADTEYFYRLLNRFGTNETITDWRSFRTFKPSGKVTFNVVGDSGWGSLPQLQIAEQMEKTPADFLMHLGDLVYYAITYGNADLRLFSVYAEEMGRRPWFLAVGNHENYVDPAAALNVFYLPTNNVTGTEHFYSFDHGDAHIAVAYSDLLAGPKYESGSPQYQWLDADLASTTKPWKFLFFHHTWRTSAHHQIDDYDRNAISDSQQLDQGLAQLARKHGVQIIFNGHDHCYERLAPSGGPMSFISGGGGASIYFMTTPHPDDVQFHARYHFLRVAVEGEETRVDAIDLNGTVFDTVQVRKRFPEPIVHEAEWHTPELETPAGGPGDQDGNIPGQVFDFRGTPIVGRMGLSSSAGRLFVNNDRTNLYLGLDQIMLGEGEELVVFLEAPGLPGRRNMSGIGNGVFDPDAEGVDTLDFLENLAFTNFLPAIALVLGDEYGDGVSRNTLRLGQPNTGGQGAFYLSEGIPAVPGQRLTQFNRSPQLSPMPHEENADFVEAAIPLNWIGGLKPGDVIRIGALVALQNVDTNSAAQTREIDIGGIGYSLAHAAGAVYLEGLEVRLASRDDFDGDLVTDAEEDLMGTDWRDPDTDGDGMPDGWEVQHSLHPVLNDADADTDGDGLTNRDEFRAGTNPTSAESRLLLRAEKFTGGFHLVWESVPGRRYLLQMRKSFNEPFGELPGFPRIANTPRISYPISMENGPELSSYYRLLVVE